MTGHHTRTTTAGSAARHPARPPAYSSTLDLPPVLAALQTRQAPFSYSIDVGDYVCNHSYFLALDRARSARPVVPCLFVHIPLPRTRAQRSEIRRGAGIVLDSVLCEARLGRRAARYEVAD